MRLLVGSLLCLLYHVGFGQSTGASAFSFDGIPVSTVSSALGGSQVASWNSDVSQLSDNPAFADSAIHNSLGMGYLNYVSTINQANVSYASIWDSVGIISGYLRYLDYGTFTERDAIGTDLGEFKAADYEIGVSLTRVYNDRIKYGVTAKQMFSSMYQYFAYGVALDVGAIYSSKDDNLHLGATLDNIGMKLVDYTNSGSTVLSPQLDIGVTNRFKKAPLSLGVQYNDLFRWDLAEVDTEASEITTEDPITGETSRATFTVDNLLRHFSASAAFEPSERFRLMLGYNFRRRMELALPQRPLLSGFSLGTVIQIKKFSLMYSITSYHINGTSNHLAISTNLSEWKRKRVVE